MAAIARMAGVSTSTVSLVLNGRAKALRISEEVEKRVMQVAAENNFLPNSLAVSLRTGKTRIIALIVEDISNVFFSSIAHIAEGIFRQKGYHMVCSSTDNEPVATAKLIQSLSTGQIDGFLVTPTMGIEKELKALETSGIPMVFLDSFFESISAPRVMVDNGLGITLGMDHLFEQGLTKPALITVDLRMVQIDLRIAAFRNYLQSRGHEEIPILTVPYDQSKADSLKAIEHFIEHTNCDSIFFATNYLCILGLEGIKTLGLRIPQQMSVICFDDHDLFKLHTPPITAISQPIEEIVETAAQILLQRIENEKITNTQLDYFIQPELVVRNSVKRK